MSPPLPATYEGPGLLDLQLNGYGGFDFNSGHQDWTIGDLRGVRAGLENRGILAALPTIITAPPQRMLAAARRYAALLREDPSLGVAFPRLHIEGPFISREEGPRGAHLLEFCTTPRKQPDLLERLREASDDRIGILTLAPELPGALATIRSASATGILVSLGHTGASTAILAQAVEAGARLSTHLGNGSHQTLPRLENYIQAQLADDRLAASFIADGHHMPWYTLQNFLRAKTPGRSILVSDSVAAADAPVGRHRLGDSWVESTAAGRVQVPGQQNLAGSALTLDLAVVNVATHCGLSFRKSWAMASTIPAALLGIEPCPAVTVVVAADGIRRARAADSAGPADRRAG